MLQVASLIDGKTERGDGATGLVNPASGEIFAEVAGADERQVEQAVAAAQRAFRGSWRTLKPRERARLLFKLADAIRSAEDELATLETQNVGKPLRDSREEVNLAADTFEFYAGTIDKF